MSGNNKVEKTSSEKSISPSLGRLWWVGLTVSLGVVFWVIILGLDRWPIGRINVLPRIVALVLLLVGCASTIAHLVRGTVRVRYRRLWVITILAILVVMGGVTWGIRKIVRWKASIWIGDYLLCPRSSYDNKTLDVCFCVIDHFEPGGIWNTAETFPVERRMARMASWGKAYSAAIEGHWDSDGFSPQHTWVFPIQHSVPEVICNLASWPGRGWGEIEYHLHHGTRWDEQQVYRQMVDDLAALRAIGACTHGYAFVHGRFALAAGDPKECSVVNELDFLQETGCYADFTFPNLYTPAQPSQINSIYYARTTGKPKPHDRGPEVEFEKKAGDGLLIIQGAMWAGFTKAVFDDSNFSVDQVPDPSRINHWLDAHVHVKGQPNWVFFIVHTHSATEYAQKMLWEGNMQSLWAALEKRFKTSECRLHYVTARQVYNIIKAAEAGETGNPSDYRDYLIFPPENRNKQI